MIKNKSYAGIDYFRFIAALLIVAIHTSPLASYSETGNFILTRMIARVAVPFFFMTSGFFLISRYTYNAEKLGAFLKKTALIYGAAILIYIPVNIYNSYFKMGMQMVIREICPAEKAMYLSIGVKHPLLEKFVWINLLLMLQMFPMLKSE